MAELTKKRIAGLINSDGSWKSPDMVAPWEALVGNRSVGGVKSDADSAEKDVATAQERLDLAAPNFSESLKEWSAADEDSRAAISAEFDLSSQIAALLQSELRAKEDFARNMKEVAEMQTELVELIHEASRSVRK